MTRISIVVPCRNGEAWIAQTLRSAVNQTCPPFEIVVVDDGSTDASRDIARSFSPLVTVVEGAAKGAAVARNCGAAHATGERIMFLDADDLLTPPTLEALSNALDEASGAGFAICPWDRYESREFGWIAEPPTAALPRPGRDRLANWLTGSWSPPCCILWDRASYEASGGWWQEAGLDDDGNLVRRALARGIEGVDAPKGLALYRRLPGDAQSYSGRRLEPFGLRSRLASLGDTVAELEKAGKVDAYRRALDEVLRDLLGDAESYPVISTRVEALIDRVGASTKPAMVRPAAEKLAARGAAWLRERRAQPGPGIRLSYKPEASADGSSKISVIIPTYNRARLVERAVKSVVAQTHDDLEILIIDDGSTDDTQARLSRIDDPRLRLVYQENAGVAAARNRGIREASGGFLSFLDSDDEWLPEKLAKQREALTTAPRYVGICLIGGRVVSEGGMSPPQTSPEGYLFDQLLLRNTVFACMSALVRREVFEAVGGYDPALPAIEDWDWLQRAARLYAFVSLDECLAIYHDERQDDRRSTRFDANMEARAMLWDRNRHALRRAGNAQQYLLESARRDLREENGSPLRGRKALLQAMWERPQNSALWPWLPYMMAPRRLRAKLRQLDGRIRNFDPV